MMDKSLEEYAADRIDEVLSAVDKEIAKLLSEIWISVKNRLPKDSEYVFCCCRNAKGQPNIVKGYYDGTRWCCGMNSNVTHWMPLPEPPKQEGVI